MRDQTPFPGETRFLPGAVLAKRYRIISLLGRGGMGEVYRADDLKLGQPVALKFLPERVARDEARLARFLNEVKTALKVTHPNVCRVYDIGEIAPSKGSGPGQQYITMEYVDGEDLASLLRRIGRLPRDKAVQIARQLCAGLAAAHGQGILHRDLKPANVMIDGRGWAKITDFGLAGLAEAIEGEEVRAGTPLYMSPEQHAGTQVTVRSDIYSLGLVLYELFTGKRAFEAKTARQMTRLQDESTPTSPSSHVEGLDPAVERVILRCLEREPGDRPNSVLSVAAALPGGDPLAAALAAGETPSPAMVAEAGSKEGLRPAVAISWLAVTLAVLIVLAFLWGTYSLPARAPLDKPADVLVERAVTIAERLGYTEPPVDRQFGFYEDLSYLRQISATDDSPDRWTRLSTKRPTGFRFWYRQSPRPLVPSNVSGRVWRYDPPVYLSESVHVTLDTDGRLDFFWAIPPQRDTAEEPAPAPDWSILFEEAGLEPADFKEVAPHWLPEAYGDARTAWEGAYPGQADPPIRVEACAYRGRPVYFEIVHPWSRPWRMEPYQRTPAEKAEIIFWGMLRLVALAVGLVLAWWNIRLGRGDRKIAMRLAFVAVAARMIQWLLRANHVLDLGTELSLLAGGVGSALYDGALVWLTYMALEPFLRRRWPQSLVSWTRLFSGRLRDPLVGRHLLYGAVIGALFALPPLLMNLVPAWLGWPAPIPRFVDRDAFLGSSAVIAEFFGGFAGSLQNGIRMLFVLALFRAILRKPWIAYPAFVVLLTGFDVATQEYFWIAFPILLLNYAFGVFFVVRFGLLPVLVALYLSNLGWRAALTLDFSAWYSGSAMAGLAIAAGIALYGFWVSLAGRPLFETRTERE